MKGASDSEDEFDSRPVSNVRRGVTFSDDGNASSLSRAKLNRQSTRLSACSYKTSNGTHRKSKISLRTPNGEVEIRESNDSDTSFRNQVKRFIMGQNFEMFAGFVILGNFIAIIVETDARATTMSEPADSEDYKKASGMLASCDSANFAFLLFYSAECLVRIYALRKAFFGSKWNIFDMIIVVLGIVGEVLGVVFGGLDTSVEGSDFQVLRSLRMLRLLRAARVVISFKELYSLICGMSSCLRTLVWAAALVFLMLTMWSIVAVEYLQTYVADLAKKGFYDDCTYCSESFSNIMYANLTFFQIVSGDGWTDLARPLIMHHPWTAALFVGVIFTMVFGMLNLITAVIVDTAAQAREADIMHMAAQKEYERKFAWENVARICVEMDADEDGNITFDELKKGIKDIPELSAQLSVMGVESYELQLVFDMLDEQKHGKIPIDDFVNHLYKMQTHEQSMTHVFVEDIRKHVKMMAKLSEEWNSSRQSSEELVKEPETEPKNSESPPWMQNLPQLLPQDSIVKPLRRDLDSSGDTFGSPPTNDIKGLPPMERQSGISLNLPNNKGMRACNSDQGEAQIMESGDNLSSGVSKGTEHLCTCSSEDDLEGQWTGIDDAISQYTQKNAFPVLANVPRSNFAQQLSEWQGNVEQQSQLSSHSSTLPSLLSKHHSQTNVSSSKLHLPAKPGNAVATNY